MVTSWASANFRQVRGSSVPVYSPRFVFAFRTLFAAHVVISAVGRASAEIATHTTTGKHVVLTEPLPEALGAICSILPLVYFVEA